MPRHFYQAPTTEQAFEAARRRCLRGAIIRLLHEQSPQPLNADILLSVLERLHFSPTPQELAAAGCEISEGALARYWRECWSRESNDLYRARLQAEILARQAQRSGTPDLTALVRELLWLNLLQRRQELGEADLMKLLAAAREQEKLRIAAHKAGLKDQPARQLTPEEIGREVRQIYGWTDDELDAYEQREPQAQEQTEDVGSESTNSTHETEEFEPFDTTQPLETPHPPDRRDPTNKQ